MSGKLKTSVKLFLEKLNEIGFKDSLELRRDLDRNVKCHHHEVFLQEFSTKISAKNMMSRGQLSEFERFSQENDVLSQDKVSLTSSSLKTRISDAEEELVSLTEQLNAARLYKSSLKQKLGLLEEVHKETCHHQNFLQAVLVSSRRDLEKHKSHDQMMVDKFVEEVTNTTQNLSSLLAGYEESESRPDLLLRLDLDSYFLAENDFFTQLKRYTKSQFIEASIWMDETLDQSLQLLNLTDTQLFEDEPEEVKNKITFDLKCAAYRSLENLRRGIEAVQKQTNQLRSEHLPHLISRSLPLQQTHMLTGDCYKKLAKRKYYSKMQKKLISFLTKQCSRLSLLWMLLEIEHTKSQVTARMADKVCAHVSLFSDSARAQARVLQAHATIGDKDPKAVIANRDYVLLAIHEILVPSSPRRSILHTFESVEKASNKLNENVKVWENENGQDRREKYPELYALKDELSACSDVSLSSAEEFMLAPKHVTESLNTVLDDLSVLKNTFPAVFSEIEKKKALLEDNPDECEKRKLWINFLLRPETVANNSDDNRIA